MVPLNIPRNWVAHQSINQLKSHPLVSRRPINTLHNCCHLNLLLLLDGDICMNPGPGVHMAFTNVRSIRNKFTTVSNIILTKKIFMCSVLQEIWITPHDTDSFLADINPAGYMLHSTKRIGRWGRGGGVACLVRKCLKYCDSYYPKLHFI